MSQFKRKRTAKARKISTSSKFTDGSRVTPNQLVTIPRSIDLLFPDRFQVRMMYSGLTTFTLAVGASVSSRRWTPSAAYDVDPLLGSTAVPGFSELAGLYNNYRVISSGLRIEFVSNDARSGRLVLLPLNTDPGSAPSSAVTDSWPNNPYMKSVLIPPTGAEPRVVESKMSTEKIFGSKMVHFDDNFMALTNAIPNNNWFWAIAVTSPILVATSSWVVTTVVAISLEVEFFARKELIA